MNFKKIQDIADLSNNRVTKFIGNKKYVDTGCVIDNKIVDFELVDYENKPSRADLIAEDKNLLFARMMNTVKVIISSKEFQNDFIFSTGFAILKPKKNIDYHYLSHFLKSNYFNREKDKLCSGATQKAIRNEEIRNILIPVPVLSEQMIIASELDRLEEIIQKRKQSIQLLDDYIKSVFYDMFGNPVKNDKGWEKGNLKNICEIFSDGPFGSNLKTEHYKKEGIRVIRLNNIGTFDFIDDNKVYISEEHYNTLKKYTCSPGDIVIGTLGEPNLRACIIPKHIEVSINKADCIHCIPKKDILLPEYLCFFLNTNEFIQSVSTLVLGETRGRISMGRLSKVNIMVPEIKIQKLFATIFNNYLKTKSKMEESLKEIENLFNSLMQKYFNNN